MTYIIEQDMAYNTDNDQIFKQYQKNYNFNYKLITKHGPAGGNPLYILISPDLNNLIDLHQDLNKQDDLDLDYFKYLINIHTTKYKDLI